MSLYSHSAALQGSPLPLVLMLLATAVLLPLVAATTCYILLRGVFYHDWPSALLARDGVLILLLLSAPFAYLLLPLGLLLAAGYRLTPQATRQRLRLTR